MQGHPLQMPAGSSHPSVTDIIPEHYWWLAISQRAPVPNPNNKMESLTPAFE